MVDQGGASRGREVSGVTVAPSSPIDEHLARFTGAHRASLESLRDTLRRVLPEAEECIRYRMPCFAVRGKAVAGFDGFKEHCSYFPHSGAVIGAVGDLPSWATGEGGTLRFPAGRRLPVPLVKRLVRVRLDEISAVSDGHRLVFFDDGRVRAEGEVKAGVEHGAWRWYRRDGTLARTGQFAAGVPVGEWTNWTPAGAATVSQRGRRA